MEAILKRKTVYGETRYYPVNKAAKDMAHIAGTKTLTVDVIKKFKEIGHTFVVETEKEPWE